MRAVHVVNGNLPRLPRGGDVSVESLRMRHSKGGGVMKGSAFRKVQNEIIHMAGPEVW